MSPAALVVTLTADAPLSVRIDAMTAAEEARLALDLDNEELPTIVAVAVRNAAAELRQRVAASSPLDRCPWRSDA